MLNGYRSRNRTRNPLKENQMLYPVELFYTPGTRLTSCSIPFWGTEYNTFLCVSADLQPTVRYIKTTVVRRPFAFDTK